MLRLSFLVLRAQVLIPALAAAGCTDRVACVAVHADLDIEEPGLGLRELNHGDELSCPIIKDAGAINRLCHGTGHIPSGTSP